MPLPVVLNQFQVIRPPYQATQSDALDWLAQAHAEAEQTQQQDPLFDLASFRKRLHRLLSRYGCSPDKIGFRGYYLADFSHQKWAQMEVFNVIQQPMGAGFQVRMRVFSEAAAQAFAQAYQNEQPAPAEIIHVTCTGYESPSSAQKLAVERGWLNTKISHAYHMGCYAAFPAVEQAWGALALNHAKNSTYQVDIIHTELCSLHLNPSAHSPEQLVIQSLFADGSIKYSLKALTEGDVGLEILSVREELVADSVHAMTWVCSDWGMSMSLDTKVPSLIAAALKPFLAKLCHSAGYEFEDLKESALFAIHPGGPKIVQSIQELLEITDEQTALSKLILYRYGNMSSATLPHIWQQIVADETIVAKRMIISLAFGPGLTICGSIMRKL